MPVPAPRWTRAERVRSTIEPALRYRFEADADRSGNDPDCRDVAYESGSTTLVTTQRCLPILRSRTNPSFS